MVIKNVLEVAECTIHMPEKVAKSHYNTWLTFFSRGSDFLVYHFSQGTVHYKVKLLDAPLWRERVYATTIYSVGRDRLGSDRPHWGIQGISCPKALSTCILQARLQTILTQREWANAMRLLSWRS